jgi:hypothetical protein
MALLRTPLTLQRRQADSPSSLPNWVHVPIPFTYRATSVFLLVRTEKEAAFSMAARCGLATGFLYGTLRHLSSAFALSISARTSSSTSTGWAFASRHGRTGDRPGRDALIRRVADAPVAKPLPLKGREQQG